MVKKAIYLIIYSEGPVITSTNNKTNSLIWPAYLLKNAASYIRGKHPNGTN